MIIDEALALAHKQSTYLHPKLLPRISAAAHQAHRLMLDDDSSRLIGKFINGCLDLIIANRQFAMPPYDVMYIEYNTKAMYEEIGGEASGPIKIESPEADERIGFLIDHRFVYTIAHGSVATIIMPTFNYINPRGTYDTPSIGKEFYVYDLHKVSVDLIKPEYITHFAAKLALLFGKMILDDKFFKDNNFIPDLYLLHQEIHFYYGGRIEVHKLPIEVHKRMLTEVVGDMRNLLAILLWLNSLPHTIQYRNMPAGSRILKGKRVPLSAHNVVTIKMRGSVQIRNLWQKAMKAREKPRRHDVRGFWRHRGGIAQGCGHVWPAVPDKRHKFVCTRCQRERWWVHAHQRGDKDKGFVSKEYKTEI